MMNRSELLERLRDLKPWLERQGITNLRLFGSYARDQAGPDSDVDLIVDITKPLGWDFYGIEQQISDRLGLRVEMGTEDSLHRIILRQALREAVVV